MENFAQDQILRSPSFLRGCSNYASPHALPPLKFHSGLLGPHTVSSFGLYDEHSDDDDDDGDGNESEFEANESIASAPDETDDNYSETSVEETSRYGANYAKGHQIRSVGHQESLLNRGLSTMNLKVEIPRSIRSLNHLGLSASSTEQFMTPTGDGNTPQTLQVKY